MGKFELCVVGLGYVGLPTAAMFARAGLRVVGVDVNESRVAELNSPDYLDEEPGLSKMVKEQINSGCLTITSSIVPSFSYIIAVPTPVDMNGGYDSSYVAMAGRAIAPVLEAGDLVVLESTVPPGATEQLSAEICNERSQQGLERVQFHVAHCPERVMPGNILEELETNNRVVGGIQDSASFAAAELYRRVCSGEIVTTDVRTAEMTKLIENSYRDVNIAFANEVSMMADRAGVDYRELIGIANKHPRVNVLDPSLGVGGHCIPVDPWFLISRFPDESNLVRTARSVNAEKTSKCLERLKDIVTSSQGTEVLILGLSYKPNVGDVRNSPALKVAYELAAAFPAKTFKVFDPYVEELPAVLSNLSNIEFCHELESSIACTTVLRLVDHDCFPSPEGTSSSQQWFNFDGTNLRLNECAENR